MFEILIEIFGQFGLPVGFLIVILYMFLQDRKVHQQEMVSHKMERTEWKASSERMQERNIMALDLLRESNERIQDRNIEAINSFRDSNVESQLGHIQALEELTDAIKENNKKP